MTYDFSKYKRVFAFGCSFTSWAYPTYADLIFKSCTNAEKYNFGKSGGGNIFITNRLTEANKKFKFNEDDLVVLMWSTFARLDVWRMDKRWITPGNIYSQDQLSKEVVDQVIDLDGVLMRDLSIIEVATVYLNSLPCDVIKFMSVPPDYDHNMNHKKDFIGTQIVETYSDTVKSYGTSFYEYLGGHWPKNDVCYEYVDGFRDLMIDYHPRIIDSVNFLSHHKIPLSSEAIEYANRSHEFMAKKDKKQFSAIKDFFPEVEYRTDEAYKLLW